MHALTEAFHANLGNELSFFVDTDRARKFGLDEAIQADQVDHHALFKLLQFLTLEHRLDDTYSCLVSTCFQF